MRRWSGPLACMPNFHPELKRAMQCVLRTEQASVAEYFVCCVVIKNDMLLDLNDSQSKKAINFRSVYRTCAWSLSP